MKEEIEIAEKLGKIWNEYRQLEENHPSDTTDFMFHIHALQNIIWAREGYREYIKFYSDKTKGD